MSKLRVAILFGGRSAEHEVSLHSALNVLDSMDRNKYDPVLIGISRDGRWFLNRDSIRLLDAADPKMVRLGETQEEVALTPNGAGSRLISLKENEILRGIDVIFPVLHGPYGEDGSVQGLAKLADLPCVGAGILGSAVGMDKDIMKRLLKESGIPVGRFMTIREKERSLHSYGQLSAELGEVLFVKPANLGSSVGISKVRSRIEWEHAMELAFTFDTKVIVEEEIKGREIECAVLGNDDPAASIPGEIIPHADFYSYDAKYVDEDGAGLEIPARLPEDTVRDVRQMAIRTFTALACRGMARVDFFLTRENTLLVNEINTIPGFTKISMYPKLWAFSGIPYRDLIDRLIMLALEDFERNRKLRTSV